MRFRSPRRLVGTLAARRGTHLGLPPPTEFQHQGGALRMYSAQSEERIAHIMVTAGLLPPEHRDIVGTGDGEESLARRLVRRGIATEDQVAEAIAGALRIPQVQLA